MAENMDTYKWCPLDVFKKKIVPGEVDDGRRFALVVLNQPIEPVKHVFRHLWHNAHVKVLVDGAVNRVASCFGDSYSEYVPDIVCGDFDSADEELLDHHRSTQGVAVHHTPDQNYTDFHKSLQVLVTHMSVHPQSKVDEVFVLGAFGGRVDQYFANVNVLHSVQATVPLPIYLLDDINLTWLLRSGQHIIDVCSGLEGDWCGLVPVGSTCESVTTSGLHWDLEGDRMEFGGLISTSNRLATPTPHSVSVSCSHALLWCIGINTSSISRGEQSST